MRRTFRLLGAMACGAAVAGTAPHPRAQQREPLARFFEPDRRPPPASSHPTVHPSRAAAPGSDPTLSQRHAAPPATAKAEFVVGVFGDVYGMSVVRGLNEAEPGEPGRRTVDATADDAAIATVDAASWDRAIEAARRAGGGRLDAAVLMLGQADGGALTDGRGQRQEPGSAAWRQLYGDKAAVIADRFRSKHVPLIWMGLPIVRDAAAAQTAATLNEIIHDRAVADGATFIDTWQAFADENGDFSTVGPDVNGRPASLRWTNGWNFTRAGARKLASFVLPDLKRLKDRATSTEELAAVPNANPDSFDQALTIDINAQILREAGLQGATPGAVQAGAPQTTAGPVLVLTAAPLATGGQLAALPSGASSGAGVPAQAAHAGRADDFAWSGP